jgi:hypothetical protein
VKPRVDDVDDSTIWQVSRWAHPPFPWLTRRAADGAMRPFPTRTHRARTSGVRALRARGRKKTVDEEPSTFEPFASDVLGIVDAVPARHRRHTPVPVGGVIGPPAGAPPTHVVRTELLFAVGLGSSASPRESPMDFVAARRAVRRRAPGSPTHAKSFAISIDPPSAGAQVYRRDAVATRYRPGFCASRDGRGPKRR